MAAIATVARAPDAGNGRFVDVPRVLASPANTSPIGFQSPVSADSQFYGEGATRQRLRQALKDGDAVAAHKAVDEYFRCREGAWLGAQKHVLRAADWRGDELIREVTVLRQTVRDQQAQLQRGEVERRRLLVEMGEAQQRIGLEGKQAQMQVTRMNDDNGRLRQELDQTKADLERTCSELHVAKSSGDCARDDAERERKRSEELNRRLQSLRALACGECRLRAHDLSALDYFWNSEQSSSNRPQASCDDSAGYNFADGGTTLLPPFFATGGVPERLLTATLGAMHPTSRYAPAAQA